MQAGFFANHAANLPNKAMKRFKLRNKHMADMRTFTAILEKDEDMYVAKCPEVGTVSQGKSIDEAIANLKEATELYLEEFPLKKPKHPLLTTFAEKQWFESGPAEKKAN